MEMMKLKNGTEEFAPLVKATMVSLRALCDANPIAFYDLVMFCRKGRAPFIGWPALEAAAIGLVSGGRVHDSIRNVVLSAVCGDGLDISIGDPRLSPTEAAS